MAHIGLLKAIEERGIKASMIAGSSVGALIGALYANGTPIADMLSFFKQTPLFKYNFFALNKPGLVDTERYIEIFRKYLPDTFEALKMPLHVVATDLQKGEEEFFSEGELLRPLLASAALPPVFSPLQIHHSFYADGGIMNNFPLEPLEHKADFIIGSNVSVVKKLEQKDLQSSLQLAGRTTSLMIYAINRQKIRQCDLVFEPEEVEHVGLLDKKGIEKAYHIGYEHAMRVFG